MNLMDTLFYQKVQGNKYRLTNADQRVSDFILSNPERIIYLSITEVADLSGTSEASIVRLCRKLGYMGFQDLKIQLAREIVTSQERIHEELNEDDDALSIKNKLFNSTISTLEMTKEALDHYEIDRAIEAVAAARKTVIIGSGNSAAIAQDALHKLLRLQLDVQVYNDSHMQMIGVSALSDKDVLIAFSHSGSSKNIVDSVKLAKKKKATIICITASGTSPLTKLADIKLFTCSSEVKYRLYALSSRIAEMVIIDCIYMGIALKDPEGTLQKFEALETALTTNKY